MEDVKERLMDIEELIHIKEEELKEIRSELEKNAEIVEDKRQEAIAPLQAKRKETEEIIKNIKKLKDSYLILRVKIQWIV